MAPVVFAGFDETVNINQQVALDGSNSYDPEGKPIIFQWSIVAKPEGSNSILINPAQSVAGFIPDISGLYVFKLKVSDGANTSEGYVQITVLPSNNVVTSVINKSFKVYPNPFSDKLVVDYYSPELQKVEFVLCNISGSVIKRFEFSANGYCSNALDVSDISLVRGLYMLVIIPESGIKQTIKISRK